ncbi:MAG TPA: hypothetical protein VFS42_01250 [Burkholderiaceae bacterium]|nr:hypothetical protein [Burkholderiaceae bacterium]
MTAATSTRCPPGATAIVLGLDTPIGLSIVRELGRAGVRVIGLARDREAIGLYSRFVARKLIRERDEDALIAQLAALGAAHPDACLFAIAESDLLMINRHRERLSALRLLIPEQAALDRVLDKRTTLDAAARIGIDVPRTVVIDDLARAEAALTGLRFPVVLKWLDQNRVIKALHAAGLPFHKAEYCLNADEALAALKRYARAGIYPAVQEYAQGVGLGQFILMREGEAVLTFQHRRVAEWPPEGGVSVVCEALPDTAHRELMQRSIDLLRALDWTGPAMVEYRYDPATGRAVLMEVNGRFWGSLALAMHCGARFAWGSFAALGHGLPIEPHARRTDLRARFAWPELKRLLRIAFAPHEIRDPFFRASRLRETWRFIARFVDPRTRYFVWSVSDPMPFFASLVLPLLRRLSRR